MAVEPFITSVQVYWNTCVEKYRSLIKNNTEDSSGLSTTRVVELSRCLRRPNLSRSSSMQVTCLLVLCFLPY